MSPFGSTPWLKAATCGKWHTRFWNSTLEIDSQIHARGDRQADHRVGWTAAESVLVSIDDKAYITEKHRAKGIKRGGSREILQKQDLEQMPRHSENYLPNQWIGSTLHNIYMMELDANSCSNFEKYQWLFS